jgi:ATP-dependent helicase/nuclease subunit A
MFDNLTLQQFCALDCNRNMVVTSGPGAGKTRILSYRFCFILLTDDSVSIPQILTLTFTEKAAEEMKSRIYEMLARLERDLGKVGDDLIMKRIREARERFHKNRISTIHSFCADLLREHPVESGIDPGYVILRGARQRNIMEESIASSISSVWNRNKELLMPLFQSFGGRNNLMRAVRNVIDHPLTFERVMATRDRLFHTKEWVSQIFRDYCGYIKDKSIIPYLKGLRDYDNGKVGFEELLGLLDDWQSMAEKDQETFGIPDLFYNLRRMSDDRRPFRPVPAVRDGIKKISYVDLVDNFYPDIFYPQSPDSVFEKELNLFLEVAKACMEQYQSEKEKINALDFADLESRSYSFLADLYKKGDQGPLGRIQKRYRYIMVDEFQDTNRVQWDIIRMLCSFREQGGKEILQPGKLFVVGDKRQAIYRFRGGDVTVFESVTDKIRESNPAKPVRMFWQDGDIHDRITRVCKEYPEIVKRNTESFASLPDSEREEILSGSIYLPHNFRSDPLPIDFFNRVFKEIFGNKGAEKLERYETAHKMISIPEAERIKRRNKGSVTIYLTRASFEKNDQVETEAALIVDVIEKILGKHGKENHEYNAYPDIREKIEKNQPAVGILFFTFLHLKAFESMLREAGLPFMVHRGKGFFRCEEVMEILQLLNYLVDERQKISLLSALRSPIFGLTDPEIFDLFYGRTVTPDQFQSSVNPYIREVGSRIEAWRFLSGRLTIAELIRTIIADRSLTAIYSVHPNGLQRMANIEKLIEIARRFQSEGNGPLQEFIKYSFQMADEEEEEGEALITSGEESPILLMTIHAAKGLEFPMVIIPELDRRFPARPKTGRPVRLYSCEDKEPGHWNYLEGEIPVWQVEVPELDYSRKFSPLGFLLMRRNSLEDIAENRRVFYVGCTRARNHLLLVGNIKKGQMENEKRGLTSEDYRERATVLDLLDDIYGFSINFPPEQSKVYKGEGGQPSIVWTEPKSRIFKGIHYGREGSNNYDLGVYDERIKGLDLTGPIKSPPYLQLSFESFRIFKKCPVKFYFNVVLGVKLKGKDLLGSMDDESFVQETDTREADQGEYTSESALFLGELIHEYLEKHHFGDPFGEGLLISIWERLIDSERERYGLDNDTPLKLREKAFRQLKNTVYDKRLIRIFGGKACYAEVPFLLRVSRGIEFRGVIDRLSRDMDKGDWTIIDWKSNDLDGKEPEDVAEENGYHLQLACYKWATERILNEKVGSLYIYFTDKNYLLESRMPCDTKDIFNEMLVEIIEYEKNMDYWTRGLKEIKKDIKECRFCEYRENLCKEGRDILS